jgi:hypothetical protein
VDWTEAQRRAKECGNHEAQVWTDWAIGNGFNPPPANMPYPNPFSRHNWEGRVESVDGTDDKEVPENSFVFLLAGGDSGQDWDGYSAGVALIEDGRWICWYTDWGPTGDGFSCDAYDGDATIYVATDPREFQKKALGSEGRMLCGWALTSDLP